MGYYNPIYQFGPEKFARTAAKAGVDGLIVVDLPPEESEELNQHLRGHGIHLIFLAAPTTDSTRLPRVIEHASGFLYYVAVKGVTGTKSADMNHVGKAVSDIRQSTDIPVGVGFGIRTSDQAAEVAVFADAVVVGSAIVDIISEGLESDGIADADLTKRVLAFVRSLSQGVRGARPGSETKAAGGEH